MRLRTSLHALLGLGDGVGIRHRVVGRRQFRHRADSVPCGWSRPGTSARPACAPGPLRSATASRGISCTLTRSVFSSSSPERSASRMAASCCAISLTRASRSVICSASSAARWSSSILSASRRERCSPKRPISGAMALRRVVVSRNCCSSRPIALRSPRCRSSSPASSARVAACSSPMVAAWPSSFSSSCRSASSAASRSARMRSFSVHRGAVAARAARPISRRRGAAAPVPAAPPRAANWRATGRRPACAFRDRAPPDLSRATAAARAAAPVPPPGPRISCCNPSRRDTCSSSFCSRPLQLHRQFARFALHRQRSRARLLTAGHRVAVVADAVGQQEIQVRIGHREALRRGAIFRQETQRDPRQQVDRRDP